MDTPKDDVVPPQVIDLKAEDVTGKPDDPPPDSSAHEVEKGAAEDPIPPPPPPAGPRKSTQAKSRPWWWAVAMVAAVILGALFYRSLGEGIWPSDVVSQLQLKTAALEGAIKGVSDNVAVFSGALDGLKNDTAKLAGDIAGSETSAAKLRDSLATSDDAIKSLSGRTDEIEAVLKSISAEVDALKSAPPPTAPAGDGQPVADTAALSALNARVATLEKDIAALKAERKQTTSDEASAGVLSQALSDLKAKYAAGAPFAEEFSRISRMVPAAPGLDLLSQYAPKGIANAAGLAGELRALIPSLPTIKPEAPPADPSYWDWLTSELGNVVTVRNLGETDWRELSERAAAFAEAGDLGQALTVLASVEAPLPDALSQWRERVKQRRAADAALENVSAAVLRQLAALGGSP